MSERTCSVADCDAPTSGRGLCSKHWQRWRRTGDPEKLVGRGRVAVDLAGRRVGRLVVLGRSDRKSRYGAIWTCRCDCGNETEVVATRLIGETVASCGCRTGPWKHGGARRGGQHPLYDVWLGMKARCQQANHSDYHRYGGRGISVCERWNNFASFLADVGERPADPEGWASDMPCWSLDRIDPDGDYEPSNVRWATWTEQAANRRPRTGGVMK